MSWRVVVMDGRKKEHILSYLCVYMCMCMCMCTVLAARAGVYKLLAWHGMAI
jgi:hypothetical protein